MKELGPWDRNLQMPIENPPVSSDKLAFTRWLVEQGRIGRVMGPSGGDFALALAIKVETPTAKLTKHISEVGDY